jgi:hypothetical protein
MQALKRSVAIAAFFVGALPPAVGVAALSDEIQVYAADINAPGDFGLELHVNTTPNGRQTPDYPGEATPHHGLRITPELSYGLTSAFEAGLYLPTNRDPDGTFELAGAKLRLKWLPITPAGDEEGPFLGVNGELSRLKQRYSESRSSLEVRFIGGHRSTDWLFAVNPILGWNLSDAPRSGTPDFSLDFKIARAVGNGVSLGIEYYSELGSVSHLAGWSRQTNTLFAAMDLARSGWDLNLGIGFGLTSSADHLTVKAIVGFPF